MNKQNPAYDVLSELNDHYSKTKDPNTALKIISLVESELKYELNRMKTAPEKGFFETIFGIRIGVKWMDNLDMYDPFHYYHILAKEHKERRDAHYLKNLNARFGVDATLKEKDWTRVVDVDERVQEIYESFFCALPRLARNLSCFTQSIEELLSNKMICLDGKAFSELDDMEKAFEGIVEVIKDLIHSNGDECKRYPDAGCIDFFLSINTEKTPEERFQKFQNMSQLVVNDGTLKVLRAIADERKRQISVEGYTIEHDDEHIDGSIANSAAHYICADENINLWTWDKNFDKKEKHSRDKQLLIGSTMTVAEMERRNRMTFMNTHGLFTVVPANRLPTGYTTNGRSVFFKPPPLEQLFYSAHGQGVLLLNKTIQHQKKKIMVLNVDG